jgi:hypothetical protein
MAVLALVSGAVRPWAASISWRSGSSSPIRISSTPYRPGSSTAHVAGFARLPLTNRIPASTLTERRPDLVPAETNEAFLGCIDWG